MQYRVGDKFADDKHRFFVRRERRERSPCGTRRGPVRRQTNLDVRRSAHRRDRFLRCGTLGDIRSCGPRFFHDCLPSPSDLLDFKSRSGDSGAAVIYRGI